MKKVHGTSKSQWGKGSVEGIIRGTRTHNGTFAADGGTRTHNGTFAADGGTRTHNGSILLHNGQRLPWRQRQYLVAHRAAALHHASIVHHCETVEMELTGADWAAEQGSTCSETANMALPSNREVSWG